jgi:homoserine/homoserine lactone efflux protein
VQRPAPLPQEYGDMDWLAMGGLVGAAAVNSAAPGPCILVTMTRAATHGIRSGLGVTMGILLSIVLLLTVAWSMILGISSVPGEALQILRSGGLLLLVGLALLMLRAEPLAPRVEPSRAGTVSVMERAGGGALEPLHLLFIFALLPQFVDLAQLDAAAITLATTAVLIGMPYLGACAFAGPAAA